MHILFISQLFETENEPGSDRNLFFCRQLVKAGHKVTVITSNVDYKRAIPKFPGSGWKTCKTIDGIDVWYVYSYANFRGSFIKRFIYFLTYMFPTFILGMQVSRPDIIYAISTPLNVGLLGTILSKLRGARFVFEVTDVWPDAAVASGVVSNKVLIGAARTLEMYCYNNATKIVGLTQGIINNIAAKGITCDKLALITNGVDLTLFSDEIVLSRDKMRERNGFRDKVICMYLGAHGAYNSLWTIIEAAEAMKDHKEIFFVFIGDGDVKQGLMDYARVKELSNVTFLPPIPRNQSPEWLVAADIFLLPNRKGEFFQGNLPNKLFDYLASGQPIVVAGSGETADLVAAADAGIIVDAENSQAMADAIKKLAENSETRRTMGRNARKYVFSHYERRKISDRFLLMLEKM